MRWRAWIARSRSARTRPATTATTLDALAGRYDLINIKLDKTGGLTEALALRDAALERGLRIMVGCMVATSLSMAPALLVADGAAYVDLDGPLWLAEDRTPRTALRPSPRPSASTRLVGLNQIEAMTSVRGDRLKQLRAFCHAARLGSISRAAEHIMSSQPAVSLQVRVLEQELGVALFERRGPRIVLTRAGESLYERAMPLVVGIDRLPGTFAEDHYGVVEDVLTIGAGQTSAAYLLPEYVERFRERWPDFAIEIRTASGEQRLRWLRGYEVDLVVASVDVAPRDVDFHPVRASQFVLITPADHALGGRTSVGIEEAAAYPFVGHRRTRYVGRLAEILFRIHGVVPDVVVEVDGWGVITNYVAAGVGIAFVPDLCLNERDRLWRIPFEGAVPPRRYGAMIRRDAQLALPARRFLGVMVPGLSRAP